MDTILTNAATMWNDRAHWLLTEAADRAADGRINHDTYTQLRTLAQDTKDRADNLTSEAARI